MSGTHTFVTLEVSESCYKEIYDKLNAAGYQHVFVKEQIGKVQNLLIDMHGIALRAGPSKLSPMERTVKALTPPFPDPKIEVGVRVVTKSMPPRYGRCISAHPSLSLTFPYDIEWEDNGTVTRCGDSVVKRAHERVSINVEEFMKP